MIAITHFTGAASAVTDQARSALAALAQRPGYLRGTLGRSTDDPEAWVLLTEWADVGSYRRALGGFEVKLHATPLLASAPNLPGAFEALVEVAPGGAASARASDRHPQA